MKPASSLVVALAAALLVPAALWGQTRVVTGRVSDSLTGDPVTSGQVTVQGSTVAATIREDGTFTLVAPSRDVNLSIRSIGFKRRDLLVAAGENAADVQLGRDFFQLEAIVVTGAATGVERKNLANAVATVNAADLTAVPAATVEQALSGRLAGADIQARSGAPGGGVTVRLRGVTSITGKSTPLYVIDGVIASDIAVPPGLNPITLSSTGTAIGTSGENPVNRIADLVPENIESVEVLKGASAAAIYGSKASNGVVLITTKRGRVGAPQFTITQRFGTSVLSHRQIARKFTSLAEAQTVYTPTVAAANWSDAFYDHDMELSGNRPLSYETSGSISGGTDNTRYFASGVVKHEGGIVIGTYADKRSLRLNMDQSAGSRVSISINNEVTQTTSGRGLFGNDNSGTSYYYTLPYTPTFVDLRAVCPDGSRKSVCKGGVYPTNPFYNSNPLATAALMKNDERVWRVAPGGRVEIKAIASPQHDLRLIGTGGVDYFTQKNVVFSPPELQYEDDDGLLGTSVLSYTENINANVNANMVYVFRPSSGFLTGTTSLGTQLESRDIDISRTLAKNLIGGLQQVGSGTSIGVEETVEKARDLGIFIQEEILVREKLLLTAGGRWDRSSNNGNVDQYFFYPKVSASYRLGLIKGWVDEVKLRGAVGSSGNQPLYGQKFTGLSTGSMSGVPSYLLNTSSGDVNLRPERQREIEGGIDGTLLGGRATIEITGYEKKITDLLLNRSLARSTGFSTQIFNGGVMRTRGLELSVGAVPLQGKSLTWSARANMFLSRCKIVQLPVPTFGNIEEGKSCTQVRGRDTLPNGVSEQKVIGDATPKYKVGFTNDLGFHGLKFYTLLDWQSGSLVTDGNMSEYDQGLNNPDCGELGANGVSVCTNRRTASAKTAFVYTSSASYAKLREVSLSYDLPGTWVKKAWSGARYVRLVASGRNLVTITDFTGGDPEQGSSSTVQGTGSNSKKYPPSRQFWFSVDVGF